MLMSACRGRLQCFDIVDYEPGNAVKNEDITLTISECSTDGESVK